MPVLIEGITINQENRDSFFKELKEKSFSVNWPYWAGILDGDGCLSKKTIQFAIIDKEPVQKLSELFKSSLLIRLDSKKNRLAYICQPRYTTQFSGEKYMYLLQKIYPFTIEKREAIASVLEHHKQTIPDGFYLHHTREEFFAWLAGYAEAEGHFRFDNKVRAFFVRSTNYTVIDYLLHKLRELHIIRHATKSIDVRKAFVRFEKQKNYNITRKETYGFHITGLDLQRLYHAILPYMLMERKIDKVKQTLSYFSVHPPKQVKPFKPGVTYETIA
jgi:hypothetical protein